MLDLCGLPPAPAEAKKRSGFCAAQDQDNQPSSYCLPMGDATLDVLMDIDDHLIPIFRDAAKLWFVEAAASSLGQEVVLLLHQRRGGNPATTHPHAITEVRAITSYKNLKINGLYL